MSDVVNLNRFRKKKARAEKETRAEENRVKYGRHKNDVAKVTAEKNKQEKFLDSHERDSEDL